MAFVRVKMTEASLDEWDIVPRKIFAENLNNFYESIAKAVRKPVNAII